MTAEPCKCHFCTYQNPLFKKIKDGLESNPEILALFLEFAENLWLGDESNSTNLAILESKLQGTWPGYETYKQRLTLIKK